MVCGSFTAAVLLPLLCLLTLAMRAAPLVLTVTADSFAMERVALLPFKPVCCVPCGDADHDGQPEMYLQQSLFGVFALEHIGGNVFVPESLPFTTALNYSVVDADRDGKCELLASYCDTSATMLGVFEAQSASGLPESLVCSFGVGASYLYAVTDDVDLDSLREVLALWESFHCIVVYENRGDNAYELVTELEAQYTSERFCVTTDMDQDGWPEVVGGSGNGRLAFFEAAGNDSFVFLTQQIPMYGPCRGLVGVPDMDKDGRPELVSLLIDYGLDALLSVHESPCNDSFAVVWQDSFPGNVWYTDEDVSVGDIDGDSTFEFAVDDGYGVRLYRCTGDDSYELIWRDEQYRAPLELYDVNADGRDELVCLYDWEQTAVLAWQEVGVAEREVRRVEGVQLAPSIVRPGVAVRMEGLESRVSVQVLDAAGRVVAEPEDGVWRTDGVSPGVYFFRFGLSAAGCQPSAVPARKVLVVE